MNPQRDKQTQRQLAKAKKLIQAKQFEDARAILITLDDPVAQQWLQRLNAAPATVTQPKRRRFSCLTLILLFFLCSIILVIAQSINDNQFDNDQQVEPLSFVGTQNSVIGPINIPTSRYRAVVTTTGYIIVNIETLSGTCETDLFGTLFLLLEGQATEGAEAVLRSKDCRATINISNVTAPWSLRLEQIR